MATESKRYIVKNSNDPMPGRITEEKESELKEFIDYAKIVMGTLGHKVFEPLSPAVERVPEDEDAKNNEEPIFYIARNGVDAQCKLTSDGIVVLAGSAIRKEVVPSCPEYSLKMRAANKDNIDQDYRLLKDLLFKTPSGASAFVLGAPTNGNVEWKTEDGRTLKAVEASGAEDTTDAAHTRHKRDKSH
jgi:hypothetical protein